MNFAISLQVNLSHRICTHFEFSVMTVGSLFLIDPMATDHEGEEVETREVSTNQRGHSSRVELDARLARLPASNVSLRLTTNSSIPTPPQYHVFYTFGWLFKVRRAVILTPNTGGTCLPLSLPYQIIS